MVMKTHKWSFAVLLATMVGLAGCQSHQASTADKAQQTKAVTVTTQVIKTRSLPVYAEFPGNVISADRIQVASRLMGYVQKVLVHEGEQVKAGQLLVTVDPSTVKGKIAQARANVGKAKAALANAAANERRYKALYAQQAVPAQRYEQVHMAYKEAQGNLAAARAALATARSQLHYAKIRAPFAGTVVAKSVSKGQLAAPGQRLLTLNGASHLQVVTQVSDQAFHKLKLGQAIPVEVSGLGVKKQSTNASVQRLVAAADPMTHTHTVKLALPAGSRAQSGDYVRVDIPVDHQPGIVVPDSAIYRRGGISGVFVVNHQGVAHFRMVRLGQPVHDNRVVLAGLVNGERIVVGTKGRLDNGVPVKVESGS